MTQKNLDTDTEELKEIAPLLFSLPKKNAFVAPENYFEKLSVHITDRVHTEKNKSRWQLMFEFLTPPNFALAAVVIVVLVGVSIFNQKQNRAISPLEMTASNISKLSDDEILSQVDVTVLADVLDDNTEDALVTDEEDYLIDNHTDLNSIINAL